MLKQLLTICKKINLPSLSAGLYLYSLHEGSIDDLAHALNSGLLPQLTTEEIDHLLKQKIIEPADVALPGIEYQLSDIGKALLNKRSKSVVTSPFFNDILDVYPKREGLRRLHSRTSETQNAYTKKIKEGYKKAGFESPEHYHQYVLLVIQTYVAYKQNAAKLYKTTGDRSYWIEAFPLLSTFVNQLEDRIAQYEDLLSDDDDTLEGPNFKGL
jgi:hypothetical protein